MSLPYRLASLSTEYAETFLRFVCPILVHWFHVNIVNSMFNIVMLEPDFGSIVFVTAASLQLRKFKSLFMHEVYRSDIEVVRTMLEVSMWCEKIVRTHSFGCSCSQIMGTIFYSEILLRCCWIPLNYLLYALFSGGYVVSFANFPVSYIKIKSNYSFWI